MLGEDGDPDYHLRATSPLSTNASEAPSFERAKLGRTTAGDLAKCPKCLRRVPPHGRQGHLARAHGIYADWESVTVDTPQNLADHHTREQFVKCPECRVNVKGANIQRHMRRVHHAAWADAADSPSGSLLDEALIQSHDEPRDGGKYIGHMRREFDGKFGSMPLYDDYGDEANAD